MYPWFWFWAPQIRMPWSGNVAQDIDPTTDWFFNSIQPGAGIGYIEAEAFEVASYGRQLGLISEVLLHLAKSEAVDREKAGESLRRLERIYGEIEAVKKLARHRMRDDLIAQLEDLRETDKVTFVEVLQRFAAVTARETPTRDETQTSS